MKARTRIKICGITDPSQVSPMAALGVDAVGLVFAEGSPRYLEKPLAADIAAACPPFLTRVALFRNASSETIRSVLHEVSVDLLQFHGDESNAFAAQFDCPFMRAVGTGGQGGEAQISRFPDARALLLDSHAPGASGGSGEAGDWNTIQQLANEQNLKYWLLAGGLTPENVGEAIRQARPYGVDVSSGVESSPGSKDMTRIERFVSAVRRADGLC